MRCMFFYAVAVRLYFFRAFPDQSDFLDRQDYKAWKVQKDCKDQREKKEHEVPTDRVDQRVTG